MKYLLDTHVFLWWCQNEKISSEGRSIIHDSSNEIYISIASLWEMIIKEKTGKIILENHFLNLVQTNKFLELPIKISHLATLRKLPLHHRDPFDRLLIAQSKSEHIPILTRDKEFEHYHAEIILV